MVFALSEDFVKAVDVKDIKPSQMKEVEVNGEKVCLANVEGKYYAIGNVCTHLGGPLARGKLEGYEVQCPWHGSRFDIRNGIVARPPAMRSEPTYEIKIENGIISLRKRATQDQS
ncbi:MAG: non-heme iron oxygenase ferredoxin subunit [Thermoproteota archaeon]|nr:non-heme iron oxygenase ferredoxin subunit [Thermoproteota archaeon]